MQRETRGGNRSPIWMRAQASKGNFSVAQYQGRDFIVRKFTSAASLQNFRRDEIVSASKPSWITHSATPAGGLLDRRIASHRETGRRRRITGQYDVNQGIFFLSHFLLSESAPCAAD